MNKKFKLTDKVTKESIRSSEFKRWLMRTLAVVCIISLIFQFSTCVYQGLSAYAAEEPVDSSIVGEFVFNDVINTSLSNTEFTIDGYYNGTYFAKVWIVSNSRGVIIRLRVWTDYPTNNSTRYDVIYDSINLNGWQFDERKIIFYGGSDENNVQFVDFVSNNSSRYIPSYDFTNEIRVFNDELTFFITDQASWANVFYFDYEILGLGVCDYLSLQRTTSNQYLMGYNVVSDGADGYFHTSYRYYVAQSRGGFLRENYKTIRFISNPEDTNLQQWLLDNTTLIGTVDDQETYDYIYDMGYNVGYNSGYELGFANSLIGDSLSGPINALSSITLIQIGDTVITLGGVIMTAIALCLVLAFLKLYAGG